MNENGSSTREEHQELDMHSPDFIGPRLPESGDDAVSRTIESSVGDGHQAVTEAVGGNALAGEEVVKIEGLPDEEAAEVHRLIQELEIGPKEEGTTRFVEREDADRLVLVARICLRHDVSVAGVLEEKEIPTAMIWKSAERYDIPLLDEKQSAALGVLEQELNVMLEGKLPYDVTSRKDSNAKRRIGILRALYRMNRQTSDATSLGDKLGRNNVTVAKWEKAIRAEDWAEIAPDLFGEEEEANEQTPPSSDVSESNVESAQADDASFDTVERAVAGQAEDVTQSTTDAHQESRQQSSPEEALLREALQTQATIAELLRHIGDAPSDPRLPAALQLATANAATVNMITGETRAATPATIKSPTVEQSVTMQIGAVRVSIKEGQPGTIIILGEDANHPKVVQ